MSIFKKKTTKPVEQEKAASKTLLRGGEQKNGGTGEYADVLVRPRVTEKAAILAEKNTYVFEVAPRSNKILIAKAVSAIYGVKPLRVNVITLPRTNVFVRGRMGARSSVRKALVTLRKGDKIKLI